MCGRFAYYETEDLEERYGLAERSGTRYGASYNIAPGQQVPVILLRDGSRAVDVMTWGLVPFWARDAKIGYKMINARAETIFSKPAWRDPIMTKRCLVPANGFYEWKLLGDGRTKRPVFIKPDREEGFAFGGVYSRWNAPDGTVLSTFAVVTTAASAPMAFVHDRMPVMLPRADEERWLDPGLDRAELETLLVPSREPLVMTPVSTGVNSVRNNHAGLIAAVDPDW